MTDQFIRNFPDPIEWFRTADRTQLSLSEYVLLVEIAFGWEPGKEYRLNGALGPFRSPTTFRKALKGLVDKGYLAVDRRQISESSPDYPQERRHEFNPRPFFLSSYRFPMMEEY